MEPRNLFQQAKKDISASTEWERVVQELHVCLEHSIGSGQLRNFEELSKLEKYELMRKAAGQLERTNAFIDLQSKVSATLTQSLVTIPSLVLLDAGDSQLAGDIPSFSVSEYSSSNKLGSVYAARACAYLLQEHSHLKHYLKKCFNHPLPTDLRIMAWRVLFHHDSSTVREEFVLKQKSLSTGGFRGESEGDREIITKCEAILNSSPLFSHLARSPTIVKALKSIMGFWSHHKDSWLSDIDFLLCVPFLHVWQNRLERGRSLTASKEQIQESLIDIAEVYITFMEELKPTADNISMDVSTLCLVSHARQSLVWHVRLH